MVNFIAMIRLITPLLLLQVFCLYHAFKNKQDQKWYWLILFLPLIGCAIYLYENFYNRSNVDKVKEGIKSTLNSNHKIEQLEKDLEFSNTVANRLNLANEYDNVGNYEKAKELYDSCLNGLYKNDFDLQMNCIRMSYYLEEYNEVIRYADYITNAKDFNKADEKVALGWSLFKTNKPEKALQTFQEMDIRFSNYLARLEYAKLLFETNQKDSAKSKAEQLITEIDSMEGFERKAQRATYRTIKAFYNQLS